MCLSLSERCAKLLGQRRSLSLSWSWCLIFDSTTTSHQGQSGARSVASHPRWANRKIGAMHHTPLSSLHSDPLGDS